MKIKKKFEFMRAITIQENTLRKIIMLFLEYYPSVKMLISATLKNNDVIEFADIEELINYDNSRHYRIKELTIYGLRKEFTIMFRPVSHMFLSYDATISVIFCLDNKNDCVSFQAKMKEIFHEIQLPLHYTVLSKMPAFLSMLMVLLFLLLFFLLYSAFRGGAIMMDIFIGFNLQFFVSILGYFFVLHMTTRFCIAIFPPIRFMWGNEIMRIEKTEKLKITIFMGIIGTLVFGIVSGVVANILAHNF